MSETIQILWTGGYDSTFRIVQLSRMNVNIQPFYLSDKRASETYELGAIRKIMQTLEAHPDTRATFSPLTVISVEERTHDQAVSDAFLRLKKQTYMGSQYEWLGTFAITHPGLELSIHKDDKAIALIQKHGALKKIHKDDSGDTFVLDEDASDPDLKTVFGNFSFPLAELTKLEMKKGYHSFGLDTVADMTWFCFTPIHGKPCGKCHPCQYTIEEGMRERFTMAAIMRYYVYGKFLHSDTVRAIVAKMPYLRKLKNKLRSKHN